MPDRVDFKRELGCYTAKRNTLQVVEVPDLRYLMIDGHGDPNTPVYAEAVSALCPVAYALKFASRRDPQRDYPVMPWRPCGGPRTWRSSPLLGTSRGGTGRR